MPSVAGRHKIPSANGLLLKLKRTPDILASLAKRKGRRVVIGFCRETRGLIRRAREKLIRKKLDGIVANFCGSGHIPFGRRRVEVHMIDATGKVRKIVDRSKAQVAKTLLGWMESLGKDPFKNA